MANGNGRRGVGGGLRRRLGMTKRPTTAGQLRFGDVDVTGAQTTAREQGRLAGAGLRGLVGAQFTEQERQRVRNLTGAQMTEAERRRLVRGGR